MNKRYRYIVTLDDKTEINYSVISPNRKTALANCLNKISREHCTEDNHISKIEIVSVSLGYEYYA